MHVVLDPHGRAVDALPGLFSPDVFLDQLAGARAVALADRRELRGMHLRASRRPSFVPEPAPSRAIEASKLAMTKHVHEMPLLRAVHSDVAADTQQNLELHRRLHREFARGTEWHDTETFVAWIYAKLFLMPLEDAALGLDVPDPFVATA